jgi:iduronate 2-sulfatase
MNIVGNYISLPQYFKEGGYYTIGAGKVFHFRQNSWRDWSEPFLHLVTSEYNTTNYNWHAVDNNDDLPDANTVDFAIDRLAELSRRPKSSDPFFMAVGINKPHAPHACPQKYFKKYPMENGQFLFNKTWQSPLYRLNTKMLPFTTGTDNSYLDRIPEESLKELRRAYFACVSYADDLIGALLHAIERNDLLESTLVILMADHGMHLGDNDVYGKYTNHEIATHVPLILRIPGLTDNGLRSRSLVELVDVFPTLAEAVGLKRLPHCPKQSTNISICTDGRSFMSLTNNVSATIKAAVFSQVVRGRDIMEYAIRTDQYRYIDFAAPNRTAIEQGAFACRAQWDISLVYTTLQKQLYDLTIDPTESHNIINSEYYKDIVKDLEQKLHRQFRYIYDFPHDVYMAISDIQ